MDGCLIRVPALIPKFCGQLGLGIVSFQSLKRLMRTLSVLLLTLNDDIISVTVI